jgi:hypothetical protein
VVQRCGGQAVHAGKFPNATIVVQRDEITNAFWPPKAYGKNSEPKLLFCDARPKIPLLRFLSILSIFYRLPPTR